MIKSDIAKWKCHYRLEKRHGNIDDCRTPGERLSFLRDTVPYEIIEGEGNCLLNSGIDEMWDLIVGDSANHYSNTKATIGVGDSDTAAGPTDTDLKAAANKDYHAMEATYPQTTAQKITLKSSFGAGHAEYAWKEWVIKQSDSAICLNRKVDSMGTKVTGTWTLTVSITLS